MSVIGQKKNCTAHFEFLASLSFFFFSPNSFRNSFSMLGGSEESVPGVSTAPSVARTLAPECRSLLVILKDGKANIIEDFLVGQCKAFRTMLSTSMADAQEVKESQVLRLPECALDVFLKVRELLYTNRFPSSKEITMDTVVLWSQVVAFCDLYMWKTAKDEILESLKEFFQQPNIVVASCMQLLFPHRMECGDAWLLVKKASATELKENIIGKLGGDCADELIECYDSICPGEQDSDSDDEEPARAAVDIHPVCCKHSFPMYKHLLDDKAQEETQNTTWPLGLQHLAFAPEVFCALKPACWNLTTQAWKSMRMPHLGVLNRLIDPSGCCMHRQNPSRGKATRSFWARKRQRHFTRKLYQSFPPPLQLDIFLTLIENPTSSTPGMEMIQQ
jgi:hypothetical protein